MEEGAILPPFNRWGNKDAGKLDNFSKGLMLAVGPVEVNPIIQLHSQTTGLLS